MASATGKLALPPPIMHRLQHGLELWLRPLPPFENVQLVDAMSFH
jgi:hypothetical protein